MNATLQSQCLFVHSFICPSVRQSVSPKANSLFIIHLSSSTFYFSSFFIFHSSFIFHFKTFRLFSLFLCYSIDISFPNNCIAYMKLINLNTFKILYLKLNISARNSLLLRNLCDITIMCLLEG